MDQNQNNESESEEESMNAMNLSQPSFANSEIENEKNLHHLHSTKLPEILSPVDNVKENIECSDKALLDLENDLLAKIDNNQSSAIL